MTDLLHCANSALEKNLKSFAQVRLAHLVGVSFQGLWGTEAAKAV